jgi:hypothetical protein
MKKIIRLISILIAMALVTGCAEKYELDRKMEELCKKDGGVKIYETVKLPSNLFDEIGQPHFSGDTNFKRLNSGTTRSLGDAYIYIIEDTALKVGDPLKGESYLGRSHYKIQRNADKKILAEEIQYLRAGGDLFVIGHHTSKVCPNEPVNIIQKVFVKK